MTIRIPNFSDPELTKFFTAWTQDQDSQAKDFLSSATANHSVLLQSPNNNIYEIKIDDRGNISSTLVQGSASTLGVVEQKDVAAFVGSAITGTFAPTDAQDTMSGALQPFANTMELLETITFAGASSYASSASWAGYSHIKIIISNMNTSALGNTPYIQYYSNGAYQNANYVNGASVIGLTGSAPVFTPAVNASSGMYIYGSTDLLASDVQGGVSFEITLFNIASTTLPKHMLSQGTLRATAAMYWSIAGGIWTGGNTAVDGFILLNSSGATFTSGKMQIYGIK